VRSHKKKNLITKNKLQERQKKHGRQNRGTVPGPQNLNSRVPCSKVAESPGEKKTWKFGVYVRIRLQPVVPLMSWSSADSDEWGSAAGGRSVDSCSSSHTTLTPWRLILFDYLQLNYLNVQQCRALFCLCSRLSRAFCLQHRFLTVVRKKEVAPTHQT